MSVVQPAGQIVERNAAAGYYQLELAEDEGAALRDDWGTAEGPVRIQSGRIGLTSAGDAHIPEVVVRAFYAEPPPPVPDPSMTCEALGTWPVVFKIRYVQVWSGDSYPGDELPLALRGSQSGRFQVRVTRELKKDLKNNDLDEEIWEYKAQHDEMPVGLERFTVDFWPLP